MLFTKYVEVCWKKITLPQNFLNDNLLLNVLSDNPLLAGNYARQTRWLEYVQIEKENNLLLFPQKNNVVFYGYVNHHLELFFSIWSIFKETSLLSCADIEDFVITNNPINKPLAMSHIVFDNQLAISLFSPHLADIHCNGNKIGTIELDIFITPVQIKNSFFYKKVCVFPSSQKEVFVYYTGQLVNSKQVYIIWTLNNWESHLLKKMQRKGRIWFTSIEKDTLSLELECAFTNNAQEWDNQNGNNWLFTKYNWY